MQTLHHVHQSSSKSKWRIKQSPFDGCAHEGAVLFGKSSNRKKHELQQVASASIYYHRNCNIQTNGLRINSQTSSDDRMIITRGQELDLDSQTLQLPRGSLDISATQQINQDRRDTLAEGLSATAGTEDLFFIPTNGVSQPSLPGASTETAVGAALSATQLTPRSPTQEISNSRGLRRVTGRSSLH